MPIVSLSFAAFVLIVLGVFYLLSQRWQRWWLLVASYAFYATYDWRFPVLLAAVTAANYLLIQPHFLSESRRRPALAGAVALNAGLLIWFKLSDVWSGFEAVLPGSFTGSGGRAGALLLPVGLSFYVLQAISYHVDLRRGVAPVAPGLVRFALYLSYFPKLLAGPIERARGFLAQVDAAQVLDERRLQTAAGLILVGLVRKIAIADPLASIIPRAVFENPQEGSWLALWLVAYSVSLYNDFAGYTSIIRGVSALFGIDLSPNFASPFFSRSFSELWNRWHISLSHWLRDYIYLPLSRTLLRRNPAINNVPNIIVPPLVTMLISGMWHGSGWHMLLWGGLHGVYLVLERVVRLLRPRRPIDRRSLAYRCAAGFGVASVVILTNIFFRLGIEDGALFLTQMLVPSTPIPPDSRLLTLIGLGLSLDWIQWSWRDELIFLRWPVPVRGVALAVALLVIAAISQSDASTPFVYQGF